MKNKKNIMSVITWSVVSIIIILLIANIVQIERLIIITKHTNRMQVDLSNKYNCETEYYLGKNPQNLINITEKR
jgi:galactitol-specific phosphotransferase system IIC component